MVLPAQLVAAVVTDQTAHESKQEREVGAFSVR